MAPVGVRPRDFDEAGDLRAMTSARFLDAIQRGVAFGMAGALATALIVLWAAPQFVPAHFLIGDEMGVRLRAAAWSIVLASFPLFVCIARLAKHRFFTPADIHGSGLTEGTVRARLLQALLQNTLEQTALAAAVYLGAALILPLNRVPAVPAAAVMFVIGRVLFFARYRHGAPARAYGFALTFYPTVVLLLATLAFGALRALA
jgi:hypothetical protein